MKSLFSAILFGLTTTLSAQYWQQKVHYIMDIDMDVEKHQYTGRQTLTYYNNSPDTLHEVYYHLYFNAFQPGSMMDVRSRTIADPDRRVMDRISKLTPEEIGYQKVQTLTQKGQPLSYEVFGTVLKATLNEPIVPYGVTFLEMKWDAQVPLQIRRSGRDNKESIDFTMTQWYPKIAEYDRDGWHADQYVGREFYGVYGNFEVDIHIAKNYAVAGTGVLMNAREVGFGYEGYEKGKGQRGKKLTWKFQAENVHDFAFAADPNYVHDVVKIDNGPVVHLFYDEESANITNWKKIQEGYLQQYFDFMAAHFGAYPYPQFSIIQGGDGGMEYPMCTMVRGNSANFESFLGLFVHEATHNWYYGVIGTNETAYPWMDEGFTSYAEEKFMHELFPDNGQMPFEGSYGAYMYMDSLGVREPLRTPGDHFNTNMVYSINSYSAGALFLNQLEYVVGEGAFARGMMRYWDTWKFKHPKPEDFIRIMELESKLHLDWYLSYYVDQVKRIDYAVDSVQPVKGGARVYLSRKGTFPMPLDVKITLEDGRSIHYNIPLLSMYGFKAEAEEMATPWPWTHPTYELLVPTGDATIEHIEIDPSQRMLDVDRTNNQW